MMFRVLKEIEEFMFTDENLTRAKELLGVIAFFNQKGWSPATSTNYSVRSSQPSQYIISRSGVDKSQFSLNDLILIDETGSVLPPFARPGIKSSAETEIHTALYRKYSDINCVLHTHSVLGTTLSHVMAGAGEIIFEGLEIQKGLEGNATHEVSSSLPIVPNSQEMKDILSSLNQHLTSDLKMHGFLIAGHGLYTWGKDIATARRHVETFEFLLECFHVMRRY
jgi:methylthioribulose-1-phosphate dehydratase